jgi:hypothetical protein
VNLEKRLIRLEDEQTKTGEPRIVPLPSMLVMMLQKIKPKTGPIFGAPICGRNGRRLVPLSAWVVLSE